MKPISDYIGIGFALFGFVSIFPFILIKLGIKLELGIIIDALIIGLLIPVIIYNSDKKK